jgi:hypothetical protein
MAYVRVTYMKLDLCCGPTKPYGFYGIDVKQFPGVDLIHDLGNGKIPLSDDSCSVIRAYDAIEHIRESYTLMKEIWRIAEDGCLIDIRVPSTDGRGAFQDQTHVSFWNENSFRYWITPVDWMDYYRGPCLFDLKELYTTPFSEDRVCHVMFKALVNKSRAWLDQYYSRISSK